MGKGKSVILQVTHFLSDPYVMCWMFCIRTGVSWGLASFTIYMHKNLLRNSIMYYLKW